MSEYTYEDRVMVHAPAEAVWDLLIDVERWPSWTASVRAVSLLGPAPLGVGSRVRIRQPRLPAATWTVERLSPGRSFCWASKGTGVRTMADHRVEPLREGCNVTLELRQLGALAGLAHLLFGRLVQRYVRMEAQGLKRRAESVHGEAGRR